MAFNPTLKHLTTRLDGGVVWAASTEYLADNVVIYLDASYRCLVNHTAGSSFVTDLLANKWVKLSASEINYIANSSALVDTSGYSAYADAAGAAPVDGAGGSPSVTFTRSTTSPLRGVADFNFTKPAGASHQGNGVSYDFTIDNADLAKVLTVTFDYEVVSGTYSDGDLTVYIIQDPTGTPVVIQPAGYTILSGTAGTKLREIATFQTASNVTSYRLCFHCASSTNTSAYVIAMDNISVSPQTTVQGAAVSDWVSYTPTIATGQGSIVASNLIGKYRRVGDSAEVVIQYDYSSGTGAAANFTITTPFTMDGTKLPGNGMVGSGFYFSNATGFLNTDVRYVTATSVIFTKNGIAGFLQGTDADDAGAGITAKFTIPVSGWASQTVLSQDTDTRVVAAGGTFAGTSIPTQAAEGSETRIEFNSTYLDTHATTTIIASSKYTFPVSGVYKISATLADISAAGAFATILKLFKNGSNLNGRFARSDGNASQNGITGTALYYFNAGDYIDFRIFQNSGSPKTFATTSFWSIERLSGPATIASSETVAMARAGSVVRSVPVAGAYLDFDNASGFTDTHGAWRAGSGYVAGTGAWSVQPAYVVPVSGIYSVSVRIILGSTAGFKQLFIHKNGSTFASTADDNTFAGNFPLSMHGQIRCNAGDLLQVFFAPQNAQNAPSTVTNFWTGIEISRVGN